MHSLLHFFYLFTFILAAQALRCSLQAFASGRQLGLLCGARASLCSVGSSLAGPCGLSGCSFVNKFSCGPGLSYPAVSVILAPPLGIEPMSLHGKVNIQPLDHQGNPLICVLIMWYFFLTFSLYMCHNFLLKFRNILQDNRIWVTIIYNWK